MNVFYLSEDPIEAAQMSCDRHVVKMILESAQLLSTAHRILDGNEITEDKLINGKVKKTKRLQHPDSNLDVLLYNATHVNHPSAIWCRASVQNYNWLANHMIALGEEYKYRYEKTHLTITKLGVELLCAPKNLKEITFFQPPPAMSKEFIISDNSVDNYRNYYKNGKRHLHSWKKRGAPTWIN